MIIPIFFFLFYFINIKATLSRSQKYNQFASSYFPQIFLVRKKSKDTNKTSWMPNIILFVSSRCHPLYHVMVIRFNILGMKVMLLAHRNQGFHTSGYHKNLCNDHVPQLPKPASNCKTFCCRRVKTLINMTTFRRKIEIFCPKSG